MPFSIARQSRPPVLRVVGRGEGCLAEARDILEDLRQWTTPEERAAILLDVRAYEYLPTASEARVIGEWYSAFGLAFGCRIAYLTLPGAPFGIGRMVEIISDLRGAAAAVFTDEQQALTWLHASPGGREEPASA